RSEGAAARAAKEAEAVSLAAEGELRAEERYRKIAGELFLARARPRIERIAGWSNAGSGWSDERVGEALARAVSALEKLAASPTDDGAHLEAREAVRDAYELACDRYYDLARERLRELESKAASDEYPAGEGPVVLNATKSVDADGDELVYSFDYGDGEKTEESPAPVARHAYKAAGTYAVKLTVSDGLPKQTFNVAPPPAKDSAVLRLETAAGTELELNWPLPTNAVEGSAKLKWDFGGGDVRAEPSVKHTYAKPGRYTLRVEAKYDIEEEERGETEAARRAAAEAEPALANVRKRLEKRLKAVEDLASKAEERAAALLKVLGRIKASFPKEAAVAREERAILEKHTKRIAAIKEWAAGEGRDAALLRGRIELFGADQAAAEAQAEAGRAKKVRKTRRQVAKVYWTVEPAHAHEIEKSVKITDAAPDIPPPWTYEPKGAGKKDAGEGGER
ncbi:MAG: PKD domain-containing protein, partial [Planctomycetota bacterium]